jgi:dihydroneopterin aldolase
VGTIHVRGLEVLGVHGVLPEEQTRAQPFGIDVDLIVDLGPAGRSDALADTIDYAAVIDGIVRIVETEHHQLLERLATRIGEVCRSDERVTEATVTVRKLRPPVPVAIDHVGVTVTA